ncbi:MAG: amidase, partial [Bacteroidota bacterium]
IDTADMPTTAGSRVLDGSIPPSDASIVKRLREAGAVILGKANLSEWANFRGQNSTSGWSGLGGLTKNPYKLDRNTCGSSAGSGAAASANLCVVAIGTETNGSIVCPSSANGIVGIKPTVGLVSRSGIIPISSTQDTAGPMARTVRDAVYCLSVIEGGDPADLATSGAPKEKRNYIDRLRTDGLNGKRLAYFNIESQFEESENKEIVDPVFKLMANAIDDMRAQGAEVIDITQISDPQVFQDSFEIMLYEYKDGLNTYFAALGDNTPVKTIDQLIEWNRQDSVELRYFGQEYLEMAAQKAGLDDDAYTTARERMLKGRRELGIDRVMKEHQLDAIMAPTGTPAWSSDLENGDSFHYGSSSPAAQAGYPNICVPMGFIDGLPVGISIFGTAWSEPVLIEIAYAYEQATLHRQAPKFLT